jgi:hypothetical protein
MLFDLNGGFACFSYVVIDFIDFIDFIGVYRGTRWTRMGMGFNGKFVEPAIATNAMCGIRAISSNTSRWR